MSGNICDSGLSSSYILALVSIRGVMILMGANPFRWPLERVCFENRDFLDLEMATSEAGAICGPKKLTNEKTGALVIFCTFVLGQLFSVFCFV